VPTPGSAPSPEVRADAIVVAAGSSRRMAGIDKLMVPIGGRPLLAWSLARVAAAPEVERIVLVVAREVVDGIRAADWLPGKVVSVVAGGARRQESVAAGLSELDALAGGGAGGPLGLPGSGVAAASGAPAPGAPAPGVAAATAGLAPESSVPPGMAASPDRVILVHDGGRPAVSSALVGTIARAAAEHGAAIPVVPIVETVKRIEDRRVAGTVDRVGLATAQTPQGVRRGLLAAALDRFPATGPEDWTDEAALLEACRIPVHAIAGESTNLKVTTPEDIGLAELALFGGSGTRIGFGDDQHPFGPGGPLMLGGTSIEGAPRLHGHSDGDVALHAVADALLGAAGLGDLGRIFPAGPATPKGIASRELVADVLRRLADADLRPAGVDLTIVAARPRLGSRLDEIRAAIAGLLGLPPERVNVKASTGNLAGGEGAGRGIAARAIATVESVR
jgi:2-C-methyl-D-erythritol 2,4-cyclodiphosphate synthase/2-C-methyl-D-erythritol 4-phosphate cytidylyltransferase